MGKEGDSKIIDIISNLHYVYPLKDIKGFYLGRNYLIFQELERFGFKSINQYLSDNFSETKYFLVNIDHYFKNNLLITMANTCTFNRYLTRMCDFVLKGKIIIDLIKENNNLVFFVDSDEDALVYIKFIKENGGDCKSSINNFSHLKNFLRSTKNNTKEILTFFKNILYNRKKNRGRNKLPRSSPLTYLISWVNVHSFYGEDFLYQNKYFGYLPDLLKKNSSLEIIGKILSGTPDYKEIVDKGASCDSGLLFLEDFLSIFDLFCAYFNSLNIFKVMRKKYVWKEINFSSFVRKSLISDYVSGSYLNSVINFYAFRNMLKKIPNRSKIIYPFENQPWERALNLAKTRSHKDISCLAYQFFPVPKNLLIQNFSNLQISLNLAPDILLTSDKPSDEMFCEQKIKTIPIGSFRYESMTNSKPELGQNFNKKSILCCLFLDPHEAIEVSSKAIGAVKDLPYDLWINFHPLLPEHAKKTILSMASESKRVFVKDLPMLHLMPDISLILYQSTSVCYEAALQGIPSIYVESDLEIDLNRFYGEIKTFSNPKDGKIIIQNLFEDRSSYIKYSQFLYEDAMSNILKINKEELEKLF